MGIVADNMIDVNMIYHQESGLNNMWRDPTNFGTNPVSWPPSGTHDLRHPIQSGVPHRPSRCRSPRSSPNDNAFGLFKIKVKINNVNVVKK